MKLLICIITLFIPFLSFADHFSVDQQMFFSQLDETYSKDVDDSDIWALYIRTFGHEKIMARFPLMPKLTCYGNEHFCVQAKDKQIEYKLFVDPLNKQSPEKVLDNKLASIEKIRSLKVLSSNKKMDEKYAVLDLSYRDPWLAGNGENMMFYLHVIVTDENVYTLLSQCLETQKNEHDTFINSFEILSTC